MRIALVTGGGDSSAINAAIRAVVHKCHAGGHECIGIKRGWRGLLRDEVEPLFIGSVAGILQNSGTILGTSRTNIFNIENGLENVMVNLRKHGIEAIIVIGGEDTNSIASRLGEHGVKCVGIPQTIDNDLPGTDYSIGFDTAAAVAMDALDKLHTTAASHHRVMILEVMGRDAGWIALIAGIAGGADTIIVPEFPCAIEKIEERIERRHKMNKEFSIIVISEGAKLLGMDEQFVQSQKKDEFGHVRLGGVGEWLAQEIENRTGDETRVTHLGHLQRGGVPTAFDRVLATRLGVFAVDMVVTGKFGQMACMRGNKIVAVPYEEALNGTKTIDVELFELAKSFY
ncbi:MAG: 6-phosphofructokinase [Candidatus Anoxymicrobium japonicum]|uniref:Pyrophosphate--fructose 6-phosphate 1-phosphotransferase n=1 Tax=Candidatus Anoxymicrobium japonicum TaxID=2013648 RepID=A0A2N3G7I1_9ACTN|nr:MAG: 6-phosphofructokinase [Candidatus Anoxymicrobium japonicum]